MYCPSCGNSVTDGLKYCNSCGGRLMRESDHGDMGPDRMFIFVLSALALIVLVGCGILIGLVAVMLFNNVKTEVVMMVVLAYLTSIFAISFILARQVTKLIDAKLKGWNKTADIITQPLLTSPTTAQLEEFRHPVASVTDHTTKTLDKVPVRGL